MLISLVFPNTPTSIITMREASMTKLIFLSRLAAVIIVLFTSVTLFAAQSVTVTGSAVGSPDVAREQALANALREAIRAGVGVDILSESKVDNFTLEYDRVITSSFGYVKSYKIKSQEYDTKSQTYRINVEAEVDKGRPLMDNVLALKMLVDRMQSPRVVVETEENFSGMQAVQHSLSQVMFEELCQKIGLQVIKEHTVRKRSARESARAKLLGKNTISQAREAGISSVSDFTISGKINGSVGRIREPFPGVEVRDASLGVDLQAVWTDTGEIAATLAIPTSYFKGEAQMELPYDMPGQLLRHYLTVMLNGQRPEFKKNNALRFFDRIIAKWIVDLDLGRKVQLEFQRMDQSIFEKLLTTLRKTPGITYAWRREFDREFFSIIEIETRLPVEQIQAAVTEQLGRKYAVDTTTRRRMTFVPR